MTRHESLTVVDVARLGMLFEEHRPRLLRMVQRRIDPSLNVRIDAEDVLSEAFLDARRKWLAFRLTPDTTPYAWLYRITLDRLIEIWRRETRTIRDHRQEMPWPQESSMQLVLGLVATDTSPSKKGELAELQTELHRTMEYLSAKDQEILLMRDFDQLAFAEIGGVLSISQGAAATRYARAFRRLAELWQRLHPDGTSHV